MKAIYILLFCIPLFANEDYSNIIDSIDSELSKYSEVATKTKQNEHYQPYIISTLDGKTMAKLGFTTLEEAVKLIPGVDFSSDNANYKTVIFRGSNPTSFGQSKLFIDGVLVNNIYFDGYSEYLDMPIELIKRIEVIRGSGSKSNSIASYAGSINVITYAEDIEKDGLVFAKIGSNRYQSTGFRKGYKFSDLSIHTDFYYQKHDNSVFTNSNALKSGMYNFNIPPYYNIDNTSLSTSSDVPLWIKNYSLGLSANYKCISFKARVYSYKQGSSFGINYIPAQEENYNKFPNHYAQLEYKKKFNQFKIDTKIGTNYNSMHSDSKLISDRVILPQASNPTQTIIFPDGAHGILKAKQKNIFHSTNLNYFGIKKHHIGMGYYISQTKTYDIVSKLTNRDTGIDIVDYTDTLAFFDINALRDTTIFTIEDKYDYSDRLQFLSSLSYENNTHIDPKINPKLSLVYRYENSDILKFIYSSSHRSPSWQELYTLNNHARVGNKDLKAEKIQTFEGSCIKHLKNNSFIQTTLFYLINKNQIHNNTKNNQYINSDKINNIQGLELEYKGNITPKDTLYLNMSYIDGENSFDQTLSLVSKYLIKGYYIYNIQENIALSTVAKYASKKHRLNSDQRTDRSGNTVIDSTLSYENYTFDYKISLGIKNIFDRDLYYISKPDTYEEDYPQIGRSFILSFSKRF